MSTPGRRMVKPPVIRGVGHVVVPPSVTGGLTRTASHEKVCVPCIGPGFARCVDGYPSIGK